MRTTKDVKQNKGITLIALVITIIVMLILVAVTITMAVNGGLFDYASSAGQKTNNAVEKEQEFASLEEGMSVNQLIDKYTGTQTPENPEGPVEPEGGDDDIPAVELSEINVGDYISNYPVEYTNVVNIDNQKHTKWRVISVDETGVKIISGGVPLRYKLQSSYNVTDEVNKLNSGFENITIQENSTNNGVFDLCGFNLGGETTLENIFNNDFTNNVRSLNSSDLIDMFNPQDFYLHGAGYTSDVLYMNGIGDVLLGSASDLWDSHLACYKLGYHSVLGDEAIIVDRVTADGSYLVLPVVTLKPEVVFTEATTKINNTTTYEIRIPGQN